ncbi:MAG: hypothetical protein JWP01_3718 [Myxococcales bacterium]|nr:hypothetical protein [Myxococcales bacterium]
MAKDENTAINDLIGLGSRKPISDLPEPALFSAPPPSARPPAALAPLPRRRTPAATPTQFPIDHADDDDAATQFQPKFNAAVTADTGPFVPVARPAAPSPARRIESAVHREPLHAAPMQPAPSHAAPAPVVPLPGSSIRPSAARRAYYVGPSDAFHTVRVARLPIDSAAPSVGHKLLSAIERYWAPLAGLGLVATAFAGYLLIRGTPEADAAPAPTTAPVVMTSEPAAIETPRVTMRPIAAAIAGSNAITAEPITEPVVAAAIAEPAAAAIDASAVPHDSVWQPTKAQPTILPPTETIATAAPVAPTAEVDAAEIEIEPATIAKPAKITISKTTRASKRAAAKRAKQVALAERTKAPARTTTSRTKTVAAAEHVEKPGKVIAIAAAKPMKIGATTAGATKEAVGSGKLTVTSTPSTLIYVDGRNTGMMTPKTLSLPEGNHKITLLSPKDKIAKTIAIDIAAGKTAQIAKTFTK